MDFNAAGYMPFAEYLPYNFYSYYPLGKWQSKFYGTLSSIWSDHPDLTQILLLLLILLISLKILAHISRMIYSTILTFIRLIFVFLIIFWAIRSYYDGIQLATIELIMYLDKIGRKIVKTFIIISTSWRASEGEL